jgi:hypothetical protein
MNKITAIGINFFVVVIGIASIIWGISGLKSNSADWPSAQGRIVTIDIRESTDLDGNMSIDFTVQYNYQVGNLLKMSCHQFCICSFNHPPHLEIHQDRDHFCNTCKSDNKTNLIKIIKPTHQC